MTYYRALNKTTNKNYYPISWIEGLLDNLWVACFFTNMDFASEYHQVHTNKNRYMEDQFQDKSFVIWMDGHAIWVDKCIDHIYEINQWCF